MSQQDFFPLDQSNQPANDNQTYAQPYQATKRKKNGKEAQPKNEHPAAYSEPYPPYSYHAQNNTPFTAQSGPSPQPEQAAQQHKYSPDGDAYETSYRPGTGQPKSNQNNQSYFQYNGRYQVPSWARPRSPQQWAVAIIVALLLIPVILFLLNVLFTLISIVLAVLLLFFIAGVAISILTLAGFPAFQGRFRQRWFSMLRIALATLRARIQARRKH